MTAPAARFRPADQVERDDAAAFAGRAARWDSAGPIRMRGEGELVRLWATTPFDTLATRAVRGDLEPRDVTVHAGNLVAALAVGTSDGVDPGPQIDARWRSQLPPPGGFTTVDSVPAAVLAELADRGVQQVQERPGPSGGASTAVLDAEALVVTGNGMNVSIPMRVLLALSGMGFAPVEQSAGDRPAEFVRVSATDAWVRLDARFGAVVRRRHALLPLMF